MINKTNNKKINKRKNIWDFGMTSVLIFFLFRIPVSNILGSEGNGYLAVTWEIYTVLSIFLGGCIGKTIMQMVKSKFSKHQYHNGSKILKVSLVAGMIYAILGAIIIYFLSGILTKDILGIKLSGVSLKFTSVLLISSVAVNVFRGYFEGTGSKIPTYFSKIIEVLVSGTAACIFSFLLSKYGKKIGALLFDAQYEPAFASLGVIFGCVLGSIVALIFLFIVNAVYQIPLSELYKKDETRILEPSSNIIIEIIKMSVIPVIATLIFKGYRLLNMGIYIHSNMVEGTDIKFIQQIGYYHGRILVLLGIIVVIILGFTGKNLRRIHSCYLKNNYSLCKKYIWEDLKYILIFSISAAVLFFVAGKSVLQFLFHSSTQTELKMLQVGLLGMIFFTLAYYLYRILETIKKENMVWIVSSIALIFQSLLMIGIVKFPELGILSVVIAEVFFIFWVFCLESLVLFGILKGIKFPFFISRFKKDNRS